MDGDGTLGWQRKLLSICPGETQVADAYVLLAMTSQWRTQRFDPAELNPSNIILLHYLSRKPRATDSCSQLSRVFSPVWLGIATFLHYEVRGSLTLQPQQLP